MNPAGTRIMIMVAATTTVSCQCDNKTWGFGGGGFTGHSQQLCRILPVPAPSSYLSFTSSPLPLVSPLTPSLQRVVTSQSMPCTTTPPQMKCSTLWGSLQDAQSRTLQLRLTPSAYLPLSFPLCTLCVININAHSLTKAFLAPSSLPACCPHLLLSTASRDFTINALYYDPATNEVLDFLGGRTVSNPAPHMHTVLLSFFTRTSHTHAHVHSLTHTSPAACRHLSRDLAGLPPLPASYAPPPTPPPPHTACRDFTINALYYDPATNEVLDFIGGVQDALSRTLRLTHDDPKRLAEDPLRVLRGVRFATTLGLKLAPGTALALRQHADMCSMNAGRWVGGERARVSTAAAAML